MASHRISFLIFCLSYIFVVTTVSFCDFTQSKRKQIPIRVLNKEIIKKSTTITVKIKLENTAGSGVLINKKQHIYSVITNRHIIDREEKYYIQTPDAHLYKGKLVTSSEDEDLAILEFVSERNYGVATLSNSSLELRENLFAVGFPFNSNQLIISSGKLIMQLDKPLKYGYQIGYTNEIQKGMSGGAILNSLGEVVGVNGRTANPIIPNYQFYDGSYPNDALQQQMILLSWGIPINNVKLNNIKTRKNLNEK
ncbi:MAG: serine protease [Cyanobacteria bacterium P01_G01_bin.39]